MIEDPAAHTLAVGPWLEPLSRDLNHLWSEILLAGEQHRKVLLTGTDDGVGVTTVAALSAHGVAQNLRRLTLLIEANVYRPGLAQQLVGAEGPGFSEFCRGDATADQVIRRTDHPLLHVIPSGAIENEPGLFAGHGFSDRLDELTKVYDRVLFDAAPVVHRPDTVLLVAESDAIVLVARAHRTRSQEIQTAVHRLEMTGVPILGSVLNRVKRRLPRWLEPSPSGGTI